MAICFNPTAYGLTGLIRTAYADAPEIQAAYWIGGYQDSNTTTSITDKTKKYASGMIQFNTTTEEYVVLDAPFTPLQEGALVYLPVNRMGALLFFGGEIPSVREGIDAELTPVRVLSSFTCSTNSSECMGLRSHL